MMSPMHSPALDYSKCQVRAQTLVATSCVVKISVTRPTSRTCDAKAVISSILLSIHPETCIQQPFPRVMKFSFYLGFPDSQRQEHLNRRSSCPYSDARGRACL